MDFDTSAIKDFVRKFAPTVATALGGPLAGAAVGALSAIVLGKPDGTPDEISAAISSGTLTGDQIVAIKKLESDYKTHESDMGFKYADLEFQTTQAYLGDVQSARQRQVDLKDHMPEIICAVAFVIYVCEFVFFASGHMPTDEFTKALIVRAFGTVDGILVTAVAFFIGTSRGSKTANEALTRIAEAPGPTAIVTPPAPTPTTVIQNN